MKRTHSPVGAPSQVPSVHSTAQSSQGVDAVLIFGPDFDQDELNSFTQTCNKCGLSSHVIGDGVAPIDEKAIGDLRKKGLLGPNTHVFVLMHRENNEGRHLLVTQSEPQEAMPTVDVIRALRTGSTSSEAVKWQGLIHLMSCGVGQLRSEMQPTHELWKAGQCLLYSGKKDALHDPSQIADVLQFLAGSRDRQGSATEIFAFVASRSGECTSLLGGELREELILHAPKSFDAAWELTLSAQLLQQDLDAALPEAADAVLRSKKGRARGAANDMAQLNKVAAQLPVLDDEQKRKRAARILAARVMRNDPAGVESLLARNTKSLLPKSDKMGFNLLISALHERRAAIASLLVKSGAEVKRADDIGKTPLMMAVELNDLALVGELLQAGATVNEIDDSDWSALNYAVHNENSEIIEILLNHGADANIGSPLLVAASGGDAAIVWRLLLANAAVDGDSQAATTPLLRALRYGDAETSFLLLEAHADPYRIDGERDGETALTLACRHKDPFLAITLLDRAPDLVDFPNGSGLTPLMIAAVSGNHDTIDLLANSGAHVNVRNAEEATALLLACQSGRAEAVEALLNAGAHPDIYNSFGATPVMSAVVSGSHGIIELLANWKANVNAQNAEGKTALLLACQLGDAAAVEILLGAGADPNISDNLGVAPMDVAVKNSSVRIAALLEDHGAQ